jgi:hypothetical protein
MLCRYKPAMATCIIKLKYMKNLIAFFTTITVTILFIVPQAKAGNQKFEIISNWYPVAGLRGFLKPAVTELVAGDPVNIIKEKYPAVYKNLMHEFKNAVNIKFTLEGKVLFISFNNNLHKVFTAYSTSGYNRYAISDMGTALPRRITEKIKIEYPGYTIFFGREIKVDNETVYQVIIENRYGYRVINFLNEEMGEVKKIRKTI